MLNSCFNQIHYANHCFLELKWCLTCRESVKFNDFFMISTKLKKPSTNPILRSALVDSLPKTLRVFLKNQRQLLWGNSVSFLEQGRNIFIV